MLLRWMRRASLWIAPSSAALVLAVLCPTAHGQVRLFGGQQETQIYSRPCPVPIQPAPNCPPPQILPIPSQGQPMPSQGQTMPSPTQPGATPAQPGATPSQPGATPQQPGATPSPSGTTPQQPGSPSSTPQTSEAAQPPSFSPLTSGAVGGDTYAAAAPSVIGDGGITGFGVQSSSTQGAAIGGQLAMRASAYKVTENQTPRPTDRVYFNYNYFNNVNQLSKDVHREMWGFERTFLDRTASFGMTLPVFQVGGGDVFNLQGFGNLNMIGKYAWINDYTTGNVFSTGMVLTVPTGRGVYIPGQSDINDVIFQPWLGYIWNRDNFYAQGFSAVAAPTDVRDITLLFNDIAVGYWVYRSNEQSGVTGVIPTFETHVNTPLTHRGLNSSPYGFQDSVIFTYGTHVIFNQRSILTIGLANAVTGPQPFDVEAIAQFNYRF